MKKIALIAAITCISASPAAAQNWTGFYVGAHAGYGFGSTDVDVSLGDSWDTVEQPDFTNAVESGLATDLDPKGLIYGAQAGYNFEIGNGLVLGVEGSFSGLGADDDDEFSIDVEGVTYDATNEVDLKSIIAVKARAGIASGNTLFYGNLGWAWVRARYTATLASDGGYLKAASETDTTNGWLIGAGIEHKLSPNWSLGLDYSFTNQGKTSMDSAYLPGSTFVDPPYSERYRHDLNLHQVKVTVNYGF